MTACPVLPEPGGSGPVVLDEMRVLRLCSVFEPAALSGRSAGYDAIGGMHNHTAELSRQLDRMGARQLVLTSRLDGPAGRAGFGRHGLVVRTGVDTRLARQGWALLAATQGWRPWSADDHRRADHRAAHGTHLYRE